jgi:hypothetical protein
MIPDRRRFERYSTAGTATVRQDGGGGFELPVIDISFTGIHLRTPKLAPLAGGMYSVALPEHGWHDAQVVGVRSQSVAFRFVTPQADGVRSFIDDRKFTAKKSPDWRAPSSQRLENL